LVTSILEYVILAGSLLCRTKRLGRLAASLRMLSTPRTQGPALSLVLRVAGCNSRAGLVRFPLALADYELGARLRRQREARLAHRTLALQPSCPGHTQHSHECSIIHLADCVFAHACLAPRPCLTRSIFACVILAGSPYKPSIALFTSSLGPRWSRSVVRSAYVLNVA
jgi:hypothetical protein